MLCFVANSFSSLDQPWDGSPIVVIIIVLNTLFKLLGESGLGMICVSTNRTPRSLRLERCQRSADIPSVVGLPCRAHLANLQEPVKLTASDLPQLGYAMKLRAE